MVNFVATTRRWYDRGNPRDAGEATPAKESLDYDRDSIPCPGQLLFRRLTGAGNVFFYWCNPYNSHLSRDFNIELLFEEFSLMCL